ncbi:MAG: single-stranded DNA-binding protein [Verrucomicrobia bacterium]|nr:single-stranded DNA-binding protein [Verrucomicrobiota bacterium]
MASFNRVILMGNLTKDPEVRYLQSGTAVCDLRLAVTEKFKNKAGETVDSTCFVDVVVWARQAETCGEYLSKGSPILTEGRLQLDEWKTKEGETRSKLRVRADRVQFLGSPKGRAEFSDTASARDDSGDGPPMGADANPALDDDDNLPF